MKKFPLCALSAGALFALFGIGTLAFLTPSPEPFGLLFPLLWDLAMVAISLGIIFRCEVARKAGFIWSVFCIVATLAVGVAMAFWILPQHSEALGEGRLVFVVLSVAFGLLFGIWQLMVLRHPTALPWDDPPHSGSHPRPRHG